LDFVTGRHLVRLQEITRDVRADFETGLAELDGEPSHVRLLVHFRPRVALSKLVDSLTGVSSRRNAAGVPRPAPPLLEANRPWSGSYFAGPVGGGPISVLRQYIEQQNQPG